MKRGDILFVDSHEDTRELYSEYLRLAGFEVIEAETTDEALRHVARVQAMVTALQVVGSIDGIQLIRNVRTRAAAPRLPIVVLTAQAFESTRRAALAAGADVFLTKPCLPETLAQAVVRALALTRIRKPNAAAAHSDDPTQRGSTSSDV